VYREAGNENPNLLIVDAGDFSMRRQVGGVEATRFMAGMLPRLGYQAWTPGESELFRGRAFLDDLAVRMACDAVSANLRDSLGVPIFPPSTVRTIGDLRVGITGVTSPDVLAGLALDERGQLGHFQLLDPVENLRTEVAALRSRTDLVVVLAHADAVEAAKLAAAVPGIDVLVVGHHPGYVPEESANPRVGDTIVVQGGQRGQYLSRLDLWIGADRTIEESHLHVEPLTTAFPPDSLLGPDIQAFIDELKEIETRAAAATRSAPVIDGGHKYLGADICARCHADIHATWSRGPHALAFQTLVAAGRQADPSCIGCHVTGWGDPTGYRLATLPADSLGHPATGDALELRNVQCESCHGKGTAHGTAGMVARVAEEACRSCHDEANDPDFDFKKAIAAGLHHSSGTGPSLRE
jgi:hypothetical protein